MLARTLGLASFALVSATSLARAQPSVTGPRVAVDDDGSVEVVERYGGEILLADLAGLSVMAIGAANRSDGVITAGMLISGLAPAAIHLAHDHPGGAVVSLGLRPALVTLGAMAGSAMATCSKDDFLCGLGEVAIGAMIGYGVAAAVDAGVVARVTHRSPQRVIAPQVAVTGDGVRVGLGGTF